jgi:DNA-directed RNA polymerase specialized sigma24 family protein
MYMPLPSPGVTDHQRAETDHYVSDLFRAHSPALVRLALLLVGDQQSAEDVVQDAFIGLHRARLREQDKALPYLRVAVVNGCRSVHRARR